MLLLDGIITGLKEYNPEYWKNSENIEKYVGIEIQKLLIAIEEKFRRFCRAHSEEIFFLNATREMLLRLPVTQNVTLDERFMIEMRGPSHVKLLDSDVGWGPGKTFAFEAEQIFSIFTTRLAKYTLPTNRYVEMALNNYLLRSEQSF